jgi:hypothetical protein
VFTGTTLAWVRVSLLALVAACALPTATISFAQEPEPATPTPDPESAEAAEPATAEESVPLYSVHEYTSQWSESVDELIQQVLVLEKDENDADEMYLDLGRALRIRLSVFRNSLKGARSPLDNVADSSILPLTVKTITDLHASIESMYAARLRLLESISPALHLEVTATDVFGVNELATELRYIWLQVRFQLLNIPAAASGLLYRVKIAPLPIVWRFLEFIIAIMIFRWWRRWLPETLRKMRASLAEIRPRSSAVMRRIKLTWYVDQLRRPIEWLIFFSIFFSLIDMAGLNFLTDVLAIIIQWILLAWFSVALMNAVAARGDAGLAGEYARLRQRSLRLVAAWLVLLWLGLDIAESLAGAATLYAWVWRLYQILAVPVLLVLLSWWRNSIFDRLELEQEGSDSLERMLRHRKGLRSYASAASGALWLLASALRRSLMRNILRIGTEQGFGSGFVTKQTSDGVTANPATEELPPPLREKLLTSGEYYDRYARAERRDITNRAKQGQKGVIAITGERGIGVSRLLEQIQESLNESMIVLDCKSNRFEDLSASLGNALGIKSVNARKVSQKLEESGIHTIAIDNLHRLVRPVMGGQNEIARLSELIEGIRADVLWVFSVDCFAWQFMRRARADRSTIGETIALRPWTEEQIAELLEMRNVEAGIEASFSDVSVPREFMETTQETAEERNKSGVYRMIGSMSGGNPSVALGIWADSIYAGESGQLQVRTPKSPRSKDLDKATPNLLLVLRAIAQWEVISELDIADNLRLPQGAVSSAIHYSVQRGWIEETSFGYRLTWPWFRTIIGLLLRQNLLAR